MTKSNSIEKFLLAEVAADFGKQSLDPDEDLIEQRIIDSLGILKLVSFLEQTHGIKVMDEDIIPENFQTINTIIGFVEQKKKDNGSSFRSKPNTENQAESLPLMPLQ